MIEIARSLRDPACGSQQRKKENASRICSPDRKGDLYGHQLGANVAEAPSASSARTALIKGCEMADLFRENTCAKCASILYSCRILQSKKRLQKNAD